MKKFLGWFFILLPPMLSMGFAVYVTSWIILLVVPATAASVACVGYGAYLAFKD